MSQMSRVVHVCLACVRRASRRRCVSGAAHAQCSSSAYVVDSFRVLNRHDELLCAGDLNNATRRHIVHLYPCPA